jgi:hypothetical protein
MYGGSAVMSRLPSRSVVAATSAAVLLASTPLRAQEEPAERGKPGEWVLSSTLGAGVATGGYGEFLEKPVNFDLNISKGTGAWRFGGGIEFGSMNMKPPHDDEKEWARFDTYLFAQRTFNHSGKVRPYLQGRIGIARIHPRSELFWFDDPENLEPGASPTEWANGVSFTLQPGVEIQVHPSVAIDVSAWWTGYRTSDYSLQPERPARSAPERERVRQLRPGVRSPGRPHLEAARRGRAAAATTGDGLLDRNAEAVAPPRREA